MRSAYLGYAILRPLLAWTGWRLSRRPDNIAPRNEPSRAGRKRSALAAARSESGSSPASPDHRRGDAGGDGYEIRRPHDAAIYVGLRQQLRDGGASGSAADRPQLAPEGQLRALCRAAQRLAIHGASRPEPALLALSHLAERQAHGALQPD